jgi:hypothetical protein
MSVIASQKVAQRIARKRAGLGFLDVRRPSIDRASGLLETSLRMTAVPLAAKDDEPYRSYDPTHGPATRVPASKNARTSRGWNIFKNVIVYHESELEQRVSRRGQARNDVALIYSQYPVFFYVGEDGKVHDHTCDYLFIYKDGLKQAILVKHEKQRAETLDLIQRIKEHPSSNVVDDIVLRTEKYGSIEALENSGMAIWSRGHHDQPDVDELMNVVRRLPGWFRFGSLLKDCVSVPRRRAAVWRLIDLGYLFSPTGEKITDISWLGYAPAGGTTGLLG